MWDPLQYEKFSDHRTRPALDLMARIPDLEFHSIIDLGCGAGHITNVLKQKFSNVDSVIGIDNSEAMLNQARDSYHDIHWNLIGINNFYGLYDLVFSNAALQWIPEHEKLFVRLIDHTIKVLAVQMPRNFEQPSHILLQETIASDKKWTQKLQSVIRTHPVLKPEEYYTLLSHKMEYLDIWETSYVHQLAGDNPVLEWMMGTALVPIAENLTTAEFSEFKQALNEQLLQAYPKCSNGMTLFPFTRIFIIGVR